MERGPFSRRHPKKPDFASSISETSSQQTAPSSGESGELPYCAAGSSRSYVVALDRGQALGFEIFVLSAPTIPSEADTGLRKRLLQVWAGHQPVSQPCVITTLPKCPRPSKWRYASFASANGNARSITGRKRCIAIARFMASKSTRLPTLIAPRVIPRPATNKGSRPAPDKKSEMQSKLVTLQEETATSVYP